MEHVTLELTELSGQAREPYADCPPPPLREVETLGRWTRLLDVGGLGSEHLQGVLFIKGGDQ